MKLWHRFVQWLAQKEVAELAGMYLKAMAEHAVAAERAAVFAKAYAESTAELIAQIEIGKRLAYAEGQFAGRQEMLEHVNCIVAARTHGTGDYVNPEDLALAKKGLLH